MKPQRVYEEMNEVFPRDTFYVSTIGLSQIAGAQFLQRVQAAPLDQLRPGRPARAGRFRRRSACVAADPTRTDRRRCRATTTSSS